MTAVNIRHAGARSTGGGVHETPADTGQNDRSSVPMSVEGDITSMSVWGYEVPRP